MSTLYLAGFGPTQAEASIDFPRPDRLVTGNPQRITTHLYQHPQMECGIWHCEVGAWRIAFAQDKQEFFNVIEGMVRIHTADQQQYIEVAAGEAGVIPPGFQGTFEVLEAVKKYYVIASA